METRSVAGALSSSTSHTCGPISAFLISKLIDVVGRHDFSDAMFAFARSICCAEHFTAFVIDEGRSVRPLIAKSTGGENPEALRCAGRNKAQYSRHDPAEIVFSRMGDGECGLVKSHAHELEHETYRQACFGSSCLDQRIALSQTRQGRQIRVNFYRRAGQDFQSQDEERIANNAQLIMALIGRHADILDTRNDSDLDRSFKERFSAVAPSLSDREAEVCALIAQGFSSEGIALQLDISTNTVLTYRKRAYSRLRISSQNELMRLVLS